MFFKEFITVSDRLYNIIAIQVSNLSVRLKSMQLFEKSSGIEDDSKKNNGRRMAHMLRHPVRVILI